MARLILFDIDGTLILTGGAGGRAMTRAFRDVFEIPNGFAGIPMPGRTDPVIVADALRRARLAHDTIRLQAFHDRYLLCLEQEIEVPHATKRVMPGVRELLDRLTGRDGLVVGLLTGNYAAAARLKLEYFGLWHYFACGAYGEEAPDRNGLVAVAVSRALAGGAARFAGRDVVVIGDTPLDVACAQASGATSIAVATGGHTVTELRASGADYVFEDLSDTEAALKVIGV